MKKKFFVLILILFIIFLLGLGVWFWTKPPSQFHKINPVIVSAVQAKIQPMPIVIQTLGSIEPEQSVVILPQATGQITEINFQEGQTVKKGQLLMVIDPSEMQINLDRMKAVLARDQAQSETLSADADRFSKLVKQGYVSEQQYEQAMAANQAQQALVMSDQEQVKEAQTQLGYTQITAPINGQTGSLNVKVGDIVTAGSTQALFTINQLETVLVDFSVPQSQLEMVRKYEQKKSLSVQLFSQPGQDKNPLIGTLDFIDNTVNPETGTVALKAELKNPGENLWPGQTMKVRLVLAVQPKAIVIPSSAIQIDQQGQFIFIDQDHRAKIIRVTVDRELDHWAVISKGLSGNEKILTVIPPNLRDGSPIKISPVNPT